jgi:hypothetical protein
MRVLIWLSTIGLALAFTLAGCGGRPAVRPAPGIRPECELFTAAAEAADSITVVLFDTVELEIAPWARNPSERLLFHHLYETLTVVDCLGNIRAGLAGSWKSRSDDRHWTFELRSDARFWDGTPVTAGDVVMSWRELAVEPEAINAVVDSLAVDGDRVLNVYLGRPRRDAPRMLSAIEFAVVKSSDNSPWPLGSGPYRIVSAERRSSAASQRTITVEPANGSDRSVILFVETSARDARDLLEGTADVMVTSDPAVLAYAARHPRLSTAPLQWSRTHVLFSTSRALELRMGGQPTPVSPDLAMGLARDAVRSDARAYQPPGWWDDPGISEDCFSTSLEGDSSKGTDNAAGHSTPHRVVYDRNDSTARELAERIVALAATGPESSPEAKAVFSALPGLRAKGAADLTAGGMPANEFASSFRKGDEFTYVVSIPRRTPDPCVGLNELINRAPWLAALGSGFANAMIPLTDTRESVIVNGERIGLGADWFGNVFITTTPPVRGSD